MNFFKTIFVVILLCSTISTYSEYKNTSNKTEYHSGPAVAYTIIIPGEKVDGGWTPAKIVNIPLLAKDDYLPNAIHLKTKTRVRFDKGTNAVYNSTLMMDLNNLGIKNIRTPFAKVSGDSPLEAEPFGVDRILEIIYESEENPYDVCRRLVNNPEVEYAVPIFIYHTSDYTPNDPSIGKQWYINNMKLKKAWDISKGSEDVVIGIVDSGVDWMHEDLGANIWINPNEIPDNGKDDDKNGKIDDVRGWDFVGNINQTQIGYGQWQEDNDPKNYGTGTTQTHGTHVSGCASSVTDNGKGIAGTGFKSKIMAVKCATDQNIRGVYRGYEGITYAANNGADVINCSWGGPGYSPVGQDVINAAVAKGVVVVVAAGNDYQNIDNGEQYPAGYENVVCVGATRSNNKKASFSNWGLVTTVYAPGQTIYATWPNNKYRNSNGTSMASPITAGVAALIKALHSDWTPKQISHQLRSTSDDVVAPSPDLRPMYYGRLNAYNALNYNRSGGPNVPGIEITNIIMPGGEALTDYDPKVIRLEVTNFLAPAGNVIMKIIPQNNYIAINTPEINLGKIGQGEKKNVDLAIQLLKSNPWYEGNAGIRVTFEASSYINYQQVNIPIFIKSNNRYTLLSQIPEVYVPTWTNAVAPLSNVIWMIGYGGMFGNNGGFYKISGAQTSGKAVSTEYAFCIDALDANTAWMGTNNKNGTAASIRKTINGGNNWSSIAITPITNFVNTLHFYDAQNGIFVGDQKNNKWGIGLTTDGGGTWKQPNVMPAPLTDENGLAGNGSYVGETIWFGTNKGRVIRSNDRGKTWDATTIAGAGQIWAVATLDGKNGLAVYSDEGGTDKLIASTTNGGTTWLKNRYNLTANILNPIYFFTNTDAERIYMVCSGGQIYSTKSNGVTWDPVLSKYHGNSNIGAANIVPVSKMRIFDIGSTIGFLDFSYQPANVIKTIELTSSDIMDFDTVKVGRFSLRTAVVKNTGNVPITVYPETRPDAGIGQDEFRLYAFNNGDIEPGAELQIRVRFNPDAIGQRTGVLNIHSSAEPNDIDVNLTGVGSEPVSVDEMTVLPDDIIISPNPADDFINISNVAGNYDRISFLDLTGRRIKTIYNPISNNINISNLNSGIYYIVLVKDDIQYFRKLSIAR